MANPNVPNLEPGVDTKLLSQTEKFDMNKQHEFITAARNGEWDEVRSLLESFPSLINCRPLRAPGTKQRRFSALHQAVFHGNMEVVEELLQRGADPTLESYCGDLNKNIKPEEVSADPRVASSTSENIKEKLNAWSVHSHENPQPFVEELLYNLGASSIPYRHSEPSPEVLPGIRFPPAGSVDIRRDVPPTLPGADDVWVRTPNSEKWLIADTPESQMKQGQVLMKFASLVGNRKGAAFFRELQIMYNEACGATGDRDPYDEPGEGMSWDSHQWLYKYIPYYQQFSLAWHRKLLMTNPWFAGSIQLQGQDFWRMHSGIMKTERPEDDMLVDIPTAEEIGTNVTLRDGFALGITTLCPPEGVEPTHCQRICGCLDENCYPRFFLDFTRFGVQAAACFRNDRGMREHKISDLTGDAKEDLVDATGLYFAQTLHAVLHIYHYMMIEALVTVAKNLNRPLLNKLAELYRPNVGLKYNNVIQLLIADNGILVSKGFKVKSPDEFRKACAVLLKDMGRCTSSQEMLEIFSAQTGKHGDASLKYKQLLEDAGYGGRLGKARILPLLEDLREQSELIPGFAREINREIDNDGIFGKELAAFFMKVKDEGDQQPIFKVRSLRQWLEVMSITGLIHGATMSMTKLSLQPTGLAYVDGHPALGEGGYPTSGGAGGIPFTPPHRHNRRFTQNGFETVALAFLTTQGTKDGHEVFGSLESPWQNDIANEAKEAATRVSEIFERYHKQSQEKRELREKYYKRILPMEDFIKHGWIFADYFENTFGLNQPTLTTYV